jgi:hypothetical protein
MVRVPPPFVTSAYITVLHVILNEQTMTVHKHESGAAGLQAVCGVTQQLDRDQLREVPVERAVTDENATRCGRCFDDGGSY